MSQTLIQRRDSAIVELRRLEGRWPEIAREAEVSYSWLCKFAQNKIPNAGVETLAGLERALGSISARA